MSYLPYRSISLKTNLLYEDVLQKLENALELRRQLIGWRGSTHKPFDGWISGPSFEATRIIDYKNPFLPIISGNIYGHQQGTLILLKVYPHPLVFGFMLIWLGVWGYAFVGLILSFVHDLIMATPIQGNPLAALMLIAAIFSGVYFVAFSSYRVEKERAVEFFEKLFQAYETSEEGVSSLFNAA